ncbi:MAG: MFS transporter [Candidatus Dojkabacteria bacterium]
MFRYNLIKKFSNFKIKQSLIILYAGGFILSIATHITSYINSSFIETFVDVQHIGLFFITANIFTFIAMLFFTKIIIRLGNFTATKIILIIAILSSLGLISGISSWFLLPFFIFMWASFNLLWINLDIFVESFTSNKNTGKTRAVFFTFINIGIIFSPMISAQLVLNEIYYNYVYLISACILLIFYFLLGFVKNKVHKVILYEKKSMKKTAVDFWKDKTLRGIYGVSFFLNLFFAVAVVYMPLYLHNELGFNWTSIGIMFSFMLLPFVLLEIPAGVIADKYLGEKELLYTGFIILTISLFFFGISGLKSFLFWTMLLFFSRVGSALIEAMRESRFFKIVDAENVSYINFLRTSYPLGYLIGTGLGVILLQWFNIPSLFILMSILFLFSFYFVQIIKDSK